MIYAEIETSGEVKYIGECPFLSVFADRIAIDITNTDPMPEQGWTYDRETGTFTAPQEG